MQSVNSAAPADWVLSFGTLELLLQWAILARQLITRIISPSVKERVHSYPIGGF